MKQLDHHQALSKAKIQLMAKPDTAFFTTLCFSLKHVWDETIPTACTNGREIRFNPKFFMSLTTEEQVFLLVHESMHVALLHILRVMDRNKRRWNIAGDYVINGMLIERGFKMPKGGLHDTQYLGMSTEEVYKLLPENPTQECDMDIQPGDGSDANDETLTAEIQDILVRASIQSKMCGDKPGTIPGDIEIFLDRLLNPKLPWNRILQKYVQAFAKNDYSFRKPNRRFFPKYHIPSLHGEKLIDLTIAVDTSGSVSQHEFEVFVSEVASIFRMMKPEKIRLLQFDTDIKSVDEITSINDLMQCKFTGRGGTLINPVLEWVNKNPTQLLLVFSDGGFNFYDLRVKAETLWVIHNCDRFSAPFGKTIHYTV
jgi:predicted metal-dependent peptidase